MLPRSAGEMRAEGPVAVLDARVGEAPVAHTGRWPVEAVWDDWRMGLDVYVGPLSRYLIGDWLTIVQQAGAANGTEVQIHRAPPQPDDAITDPAQVLQVVEQWRAVLTHAVGAEAT